MSHNPYDFKPVVPTAENPTPRELEGLPFLNRDFVSGSIKSSFALDHFFGSSPSAFKADPRYHTTSIKTRIPGTFDKHLHERLRLEHVVRLPGILTDLITIADTAKADYLYDLPPVNTNDLNFPSIQLLDLTNRMVRHRVHSEIDIQQAYEESVAKFCATVAATLQYKLSVWDPHCLMWSQTRVSSKPIEGVQRSQAVADGFLNVTEMDSELIAIWEFKNLNFATDEGSIDQGMRSAVFEHMVNGFLAGPFPWEGCEEGLNCAIAHRKIGYTACRMGNDAIHSPCPTYDSARRKQALKLSVEEEQPPETENGETELASESSARNILQQARSSISSSRCSNIEIICMRDRANKTLYVSDVFKVGNVAYPYYKLHTGLYIAAIRDAEDRAISVNKGSVPPTWKMKSGIDAGKSLDYSQIANKETVVSQLFKEAKRRPWLVILPGVPAPSRQPFTRNRYRRITSLPIEIQTLHARRFALPELSESTSSQDLYDTNWANPNSPHSSQGDQFTYSQDSDSQFSHYGPRSPISIVEDETVDEAEAPDTHTHLQILAQDSFHGLHICRAKLEIPGVKYRGGFTHADKPWIIVKNASSYEDIVRLENESKVYDVLHSAQIPSIARKFGFFISMDPSNLDATFAALLLENKGISLAQHRAISARFHVARTER
ncbi:hypothetical protein H0H87_001068 [Tephrocybe sp. NHM501043]|nr:hypothetical protein H0H87_001068 [Tephrocybe sp. NHM501043]